MCFTIHDKQVREISAQLLQCDKIWSYCYAKEDNPPKHLEGKDGVGDVWTWVALRTKIQSSQFLGQRRAVCRYSSGMSSLLAASHASKLRSSGFSDRVKSISRAPQ